MVGRPEGSGTKMTPDKIKELEGYFSMAFTDEEACLMADISRTCLNDYCKANEDWRERKELLKRKPSLKAKQNLYNEINAQDKDVSKWWLERKSKDEFSLKQEIDAKVVGEIQVTSSLKKLNELLGSD